ncbi:hypothetical protein GCM10022247_26300 [Allokutzneria multivorans]|uniref:DUF983 domain-containing protein n=1 Tax=Allokutzneria multivorans TaxID=1142134 RepID=A0ABP7RYG9_9PSEU
MSIMLERDQWVIVAHWASGVHEGATWLVERPEDGAAAVRRSTRCPVCAKPLAFTVRCVRATRARRSLRWAASLACLAVPVALFGLTAPVVALSLGLGGFLAYGASREMGVSLRGVDLRHAVLPT